MIIKIASSLIVIPDLSVLQAFPCRCRLGDKEHAILVEEEVCARFLERNNVLSPEQLQNIIDNSSELLSIIFCSDFL